MRRNTSSGCNGHLTLNWACAGRQILGIFVGILLGSPLAVAKAEATLPGVHTKHET